MATYRDNTGVVREISLASKAKTVSGETITLAVGAASKTGTTKIKLAPIFNSLGTFVGSKAATSLSWTTGTVLTTEVVYNCQQSDTEQLAALSAGEYAVDYLSGALRYCKATAATTDTLQYVINNSQVGTQVSSATNTKVTVGATSTSVLSANSARQFVNLVNDSDEVIYLNLSGTAVMNQGIRLNAAGGSYEINPNNLYVGAITAICSSGSKNLTVVEG